MLPTRNPSLFFALFYLWSTVAVLALPFPADPYHEYSTSASDVTPYEVDIHLAIMGKGTSSEHWLLSIGEIYLHALISPFVDSNHLSVQEEDPAYIYSPLEHILLGKATFKDEHQEWETIHAMVSDKKALNLAVPSKPEQKIPEGQGIILQMRKPLSKKGGNCMDFFMLAMKYLDQRGVLEGPKVMDEAWKVFRERYHDVARTVFGLNLQP